MEMFEALEEAVRRMGNRAQLAKALGLSKQSVWAWRRVPAAHVLKIEDLTGVSREKLRPDVFVGPR